MSLLWPMSNGLNAGLLFWLPLEDAGNGAVNTTPVFAAGSSVATFTRASVAWTKKANGVWAQVATGVARSCYLGADTAVGSYGGYFAEGAGTQLVTPTADIRDMTGVGWAAVTMTVAKTATGIDGVTNSATRLTATGAGATMLHLLVAAASSRTYSAFIRRVTGTGTVKLVQNTTKSADLASSLNSSTYTRVSLNANVDVTLLGYGIELGTSGDVIEVDFNQFEAGAFATSPMASAGAARNQDLLTYVGAGNATGTAGSIYAEVAVLWALAPLNVIIVSVNNAAGFGLLGLNGSASTVAQINDGSSNLPISGLNSALQISRKRACSWGGTVMSVTGDGAAPATGVFVPPMTIGTIAIGGPLNASWIGFLKNVRIYSTALSAAQLQAMTT